MKKKISLVLTFFLAISFLTACSKEIESIPYEEESTISSEIIIDFSNLDGTLYSDTTLISENVEYQSLKNDINNVISTLKEREQEVVKMRYGLDDTERFTLEEIGNLYGVTKECIRQTELRALKKMKLSGATLLSCYIG